jgi:transmembrane sensor
MTNIHSIHEQRNLKQNSLDLEDIRLDAASDWVVKIDRGLSQLEKQSLQEWLAIPENMTVLLEVAYLWDKTDDLRRLADLFPQSPSIDKSRHSKKWTGVLVASIMMLLTAGIYLNSNEQAFFIQQPSTAATQLPKILQTNIGESNTFHLPDGSKIVLNTNTLAKIKFSPTARIIDLKRGEINIDVAHDKTRPLSVIVGGKVIQAVGTAFNVEVRNDSIELIVTDGKVLVAPAQKGLLLNDAKNVNVALSESSVAISKGEKINLTIAGQPEENKVEEKVVKVAPIEIAASLSWRTGNLIFRGESLAEAMIEISRYSDVKFELDDDVELKNIRVAGMFRTGDISGLLNVLEQNFNIHHERINQQNIFLRLAESK